MSDGCFFCTNQDNLVICKSCAQSYDKATETDDGTITSSMRWASRRTREALLPLLVTTSKLQALIDYVKASDEIATFVDTANSLAATNAMTKLTKARKKAISCWRVKP